MSLEHNKFGVKLVFVLKVTADLDIEPNNIVDIIANEIRIRKIMMDFRLVSLRWIM